MHEPKIDQSSPGPTFFALFADDVVVRMTVHCANGVIDLERGICLARRAYESRMSSKKMKVKTPALARAKFIEPGFVETVIKEYDAETLEAATSAIAEREAREQAEREAKARAEAARQAADPEAAAEPEMHDAPEAPQL